MTMTIDSILMLCIFKFLLRFLCFPVFKLFSIMTFPKKILKTILTHNDNQFLQFSLIFYGSILSKTCIKATSCETLRTVTTDNSKNPHIWHTASMYRWWLMKKIYFDIFQAISYIKILKWAPKIAHLSQKRAHTIFPLLSPFYW